MKKGYRKFFDSIFILSIKRGLMLAIPFLILGSFALLLSSFPLDAYQSFLTSFHHGALLTVFNSLYEITLNSLALILIITIALSYGQLHALDDVFFYPVVAMISYLAFCGGMEYANEIFHPEWVFTAMCITILSCWLFHKGMHCGRRFEKRILPVRTIRLTKPYRGFFRLLRLLCSSLLSVQCCVHSLEKSTLQISVPIYLWDCLKKWEKGCPVLYCMYSLHIFSGFLEYMVPIRCRWSQSSFWSPVF